MKRKYHIQFDLEGSLYYVDVDILITQLKKDLALHNITLSAQAIFEENDEYPNQTIEVKGNDN